MPLPPHSEEVEMAIIGCCVTTPKQSVPDAQAVIVSPEFFYTMACRSAWEVIQSMELDKIDIVTVFTKGKRLGVTAQFLSLCQDDVTSPEMLPAWLDELSEKFIARRIIKIAAELTQMACDESKSLLDEAERKIMAIRPNRSVAVGIRELIGQAIEKVERKYKTNTISGLTTGLPDLDAMTDGLHPGEMIVVAAFPSCGKSALLVNIVVANAMLGNGAVIFTAEMAPVQLVLRALCSESKANFHHLTESDLSKMANAAGRIAKSPLYIEPANKLSIQQLTAKARQLQRLHGIKLIGIDYIQLLLGTGDNREQEISSISKGIKAMAIELGVPVLALSQLTDEGKLRESRSIGQDADSVWKLKNKGEWKPFVQPVNLEVEKCRDGATGNVDLEFQKTYVKFESASKIEDEN